VQFLRSSQTSKRSWRGRSLPGRTVLELRDRIAASDPEAGSEGHLAEVFVPLSVLAASGVGILARPHPELVSVFHPDLFKRTGMAGAADGCGWAEVCSAGQLFCLDGGLPPGSEANGSTAGNQLAAVTGRHRPAAQSSPRTDLRSLFSELLLDHLSKRMGPDMVFRPAEPLRQLYPKLVRLGITRNRRARGRRPAAWLLG
jgi:hypothetical protein